MLNKYMWCLRQDRLPTDVALLNLEKEKPLHENYFRCLGLTY